MRWPFACTVARPFSHPGNVLAPGESRWSCNGRFTLAHQADGNVVLYGVFDGQLAPLWASGTSGRPSTSLIMQSDGNLVLYGPTGALYAVGTYGNPGAFALVHDDGNLAVYSADYQLLWQTGTGGP